MKRQDEHLYIALIRGINFGVSEAKNDRLIRSCEHLIEIVRIVHCSVNYRWMKPIVMIGAILALLGLLALAQPVFTTNQTKNVATLGDLKIQANEQTSHAIPPILSGAVLIVGLVLVAGGLYQKR